MHARKKMLPVPRDHSIPIATKSLEELEFDTSSEKDKFMDPVNRRVMVMPVLPSRDSRLQAVEFGTLCQQLSSQVRRVNFHPLDQSLELTEENISNYFLNVRLMAERDADLRQNGYSRNEWLAFRGITPEEYQKLLTFFQRRWRHRLADYGLLAFVSAAGVTGYFYGKPQSLFLTMFHTSELVRPYQILRTAAGTISVLNTAGLNRAWNKQSPRTGMAAISISFVVNCALLLTEMSLVTDGGRKYPRRTDPDYSLGYALMLGKLVIPVMQAGLLVTGKCTLRRFSLFYRDPALLKTYADRPALESKAEARLQPEPEPEPRPRRWRCPSFSSCAIL